MSVAWFLRPKRHRPKGFTLKPKAMKNLTGKLAECVNLCNECHDACLHEKMVAMMVDCIRLDKDCAAVCAATLQLIHAGSRIAKPALELCAKMCEMCAEECAKHDFDHCRECAAGCRECAKACRTAINN